MYSSCLAINLWHCPEWCPSSLSSQSCQSFLSAWMLVTCHFNFCLIKFIFNLQSAYGVFLCSTAVTCERVRHARENASSRSTQRAHSHSTPSRLYIHNGLLSSCCEVKSRCLFVEFLFIELFHLILLFFIDFIEIFILFKLF